MKKFEELNEVEKALRSLIFAAESRNDVVPEHPFPLGETFLDIKIVEAKAVAEKYGVPLTDRGEYATPKCVIDNGHWSYTLQEEGKKRVVIGDPDYFEDLFKSLGYEVVRTESFRDKR